MTHPITPPPELVQQWREAPEFSALSPCVMVTVTTTKLQDIAARAAQWGADQELEACCGWLASKVMSERKYPELRAARRPKPPSLKEQGFEALKLLKQRTTDPNIIEPLTRVLEALPYD